jgi:hypothetical protein
LDAFNITNSDYVFLLSDDDYLDGEHIEDLAQMLSRREFKLYFTPYRVNEKINRFNISKFDLKLFHEVIYNSVLFSGLIFDRKSVLMLPKNTNFLSNCIYSQVFLASVLAFNEKAFGEGPSKLLILGGDGENYFGKNQSAINKEDLQNRDDITANYKYQKYLLSVVRHIQEYTFNDVVEIFYSEYNRRLVSYLLKARALGLSEYKKLVELIEISRSDLSWYAKLACNCIHFFPKEMAGFVDKTLIKFFKKSG